VLARIYLVGETGAQLAEKVAAFRKKIAVIDSNGDDMILDWLDPETLVQ